MSKLVKFFAIAALVAGAFAMTPGPAAAQHHHHGGGGHWHGGGGWGGGWGGFGPGSHSASVPAGAGAAIPITPSRTTPSRPAAGRACASGGTALAPAARLALLVTAFPVKRKRPAVFGGPLIYGMKFLRYLHSRTSTKCPAIAAAAAIAGDTRWVRPL